MGAGCPLQQPVARAGCVDGDAQLYVVAYRVVGDAQICGDGPVGGRGGVVHHIKRGQWLFASHKANVVGVGLVEGIRGAGVELNLPRQGRGARHRGGRPEGVQGGIGECHRVNGGGVGIYFDQRFQLVLVGQAPVGVAFVAARGCVDVLDCAERIDPNVRGVGATSAARAALPQVALIPHQARGGVGHGAIIVDGERGCGPRDRGQQCGSQCGAARQARDEGVWHGSEPHGWTVFMQRAFTTGRSADGVFAGANLAANRCGTNPCFDSFSPRCGGRRRAWVMGF